jgi:polysaccharide export outer membrane protein
MNMTNYGAAMKNIHRIGLIGILVLAWTQLAIGQTGTTSKNNLQSESSSRTADRDRDAAAPAPSVVNDEFIIGTGDVLAIDVWKETEVSRVVPVRSDGRISLPLIGEIPAGGRTPKQLEAEIRFKLKDYVSEPEVTVIVQEIKSQKFNVLGMVMKPGSYVLTNPTTVLDAIAMAGGFRDFAKQKDVYVLRRGTDGLQTRLPFNYKDVVKGHNSTQNVVLQSNDTIVVP